MKLFACNQFLRNVRRLGADIQYTLTNSNCDNNFIGLPMGYDTVQSDIWTPAFRTNILPLSSDEPRSMKRVFILTSTSVPDNTM